MTKVNTTTLVLDLENTNFDIFQQNKQIVVYNIPSAILKSFGQNYGKLHIWVKDECRNMPYYLHKPSSVLYTIQPIGSPKQIKAQGRPLKASIFNQYQTVKFVHCWIKALIADYFYKTGIVNNNIFYLVVDSNTSKKGNKYLTVIKIEPKHHHQISENYELLMHDSATRMKQITKADYTDPQKMKFLRSKIPYDVVEIQGKLTLRQLSKSEWSKMKDTDTFYIEDTDKEHRAQVPYHSINSVNEYEKSRSHHLNTFITEFLNYLAQNSITAYQKALEVFEQQNKYKQPQLPLQSFDITLVDGRHNRNNITTTEFKDRLERISKANAIKNKQVEQININIKEFIGEATCFKETNPMLFLMDYREDDFGDTTESKNIPLDNNQYTDLYGDFKAHPLVQQRASQAWCINENQDKRQKNIKKAKKGKQKLKEWTSQTYLNYAGLADKDLASQYEVCIQQLFLKNLLKNPHHIDVRMPHYDLLQGKVFAIRHRNTNKERRTNMLYIENNTLKIEEWNDNALARITGRKGGLEKIDDIRAKYHKYLNSADFNNFKLIITKDYIWEVKEIEERVMYDENQISQVLQNREVPYPKSQFTSYEMATNDFTKAQIQEFHDFIHEEVTELYEISYYDLKETKEYWDRIKNIFGISKEDKFRDFLKNFCDIDLQGKKAGKLFKVYEGIWYDTDNTQYFVGAKNGYKHGQDNGVQMRKIIEIEGKVQPKEFFPLLDVEFIRYGGYTVLPFPFKLIEMEAEDRLKNNLVNTI